MIKFRNAEMRKKAILSTGNNTSYLRFSIKLCIFLSKTSLAFFRVKIFLSNVIISVEMINLILGFITGN